MSDRLAQLEQLVMEQNATIARLRKVEAAANEAKRLLILAHQHADLNELGLWVLKIIREALAGEGGGNASK